MSDGQAKLIDAPASNSAVATCGDKMRHLHFRFGFFFGILGGVMTTANALGGMFNIMSPSKMLVETNLVVFGMVAVLIEARAFCCPSSVRTWVHENALLLERQWGRAMFYLLIASMLFVQMAIYDWVLAAYWTALAIINLCVAKQGADRLHALRLGLGWTPDKGGHAEAEAAFAALDKDHNGRLSKDELRGLVQQLKLSADDEAVDSIFDILLAGSINRSSGEVHFEEFEHWWTQRNYYVV